MPTLCPECHHRPSGRGTNSEGYFAACYCKCHDVADAAPQLLAACKSLLEICRKSDWVNMESLDVTAARAAIRLAENSADCS